LPACAERGPGFVASSAAPGLPARLLFFWAPDVTQVKKKDDPVNLHPTRALQ
jgi:hypothetical protein